MDDDLEHRLRRAVLYDQNGELSSIGEDAADLILRLDTKRAAAMDAAALFCKLHNKAQAEKEQAIATLRDCLTFLENDCAHMTSAEPERRLIRATLNAIAPGDR